MRLKYGFAFRAAYSMATSAYIEMHVSSYVLGIDTVIMPATYKSQLKSRNLRALGILQYCKLLTDSILRRFLFYCKSCSYIKAILLTMFAN